MGDRHLTWNNCWNVRDLGGLRTIDGRKLPTGKLVRSDSTERLTPEGWKQLKAYGIRTIIDLRNEHERASPNSEDCEGLTIINLPHDGIEDTEFWKEWNSESWDQGAKLGSTPLYYKLHLARMPERSTRVITAIAYAASGGVLFHCIGGRDRTGLISILLLSLLGVDPEEIADDYCLSIERLRARELKHGEKSAEDEIQRYLQSKGTHAREVILSTIATIDWRQSLKDAGLSENHIQCLRRRVLE